ncbi:hypothetical protein V9T40_010354 [Parthenolecanium corni]|uniref:Uncharacterized protein n=1 Tax=Parthenolecanium corni TaxID=536013 RepID=A0AAN9TLP6_9HEMI
MDFKKKILFNMLKKLRKRDSCDVYGEHVAMKLRNYSERTRSIVQHLVNNILFEADMGKFNDVSTLNHYTSVRSSTFLENRNSSISPAPASSNCSNANSQYSPRACTPIRPVTPCGTDPPAPQFSASQSLVQKINPTENCSPSSKTNSYVNSVSHSDLPTNGPISNTESLHPPCIPNNISLTTNTEGSHAFVL